jgi:quercetin dioxygenase-like cupin family protein
MSPAVRAQDFDDTTPSARSAMPRLIDTPVTVPAAGEPPKTITEYIGRASTGASAVSIARMESPAGWSEPAQAPEFDEYTVVVDGLVAVHHDGGTIEVRAGQAIAVSAGERVRYATPEGAVYFAVCLPAFAPDLVHREEEASGGSA